MRGLMTISALFIMAAVACGEETATAKSQNPPGNPAVSRTAKIEHLLKAAEHLEAAGLNDEAQKIRRQAEQEKAAAAGDIKALQEQIERLRELTTGVPQVLLHLHVLELSRTKLQAGGYDLSNGTLNRPRSLLDAILEHGDRERANAAHPGYNGGAGQSHVLDAKSKDRLFAVLDALRRDGLAKVLAEPTMVTLSNRPVTFHSGGEFSMPAFQSNGLVNIEWRKYGTLADFQPVVLANGIVRLSCRVEVSELDPAGNCEVAGQTVPGLRVRTALTEADVRSGQTLAIDGLVQSRTAKKDDAKETCEEVEMLILLTPEIVGATLPGNPPPASRDYSPHPGPLPKGEGTISAAE